MPDFPRLQPSPALALAVAATVADVRVGTWVYAAPLRAPWLTAWEAHSLTVLTEGRFEMGIGVGRPGIEDELRERGLPVPSPGQRLDLVRETVAALRELEVGLGTDAGGDGGDWPSLWSGTPSRRSWRPPDTDTTALRAADSLAYLPLTRRRRPTSCAGDARRVASPTSPSAPTSRTRSLRSSPSWPAGKTSPASRCRRAEDSPNGTAIAVHLDEAPHLIEASSREADPTPSRGRPAHPVAMRTSTCRCRPRHRRHQGWSVGSTRRRVRVLVWSRPSRTGRRGRAWPGRSSDARSVQRRTWCWSRAVSSLPDWKDSSIRHRVPATATRAASRTGAGW
jgi:Luciferase-like monooxygenase